jgi:two-component system osmolarity sensor histidine kinase EnvZ
VATIFMRNQVKPIRRLAVAADNFGKGRDVTQFKPEGAREVRQAASAFLAMRERISRQISQRTDMLAGVSHDLRTPLTRMKLQLAMIKQTDGAKELSSDVDEMEHMLEGYLAFARGEGTETPRSSDVSTVLNEVVTQAHRKSKAVDLHTEGELIVPLRPQAFKRCMTNLIDNAIRYANHVTVRAGTRGNAIEITVDDDGPGIPEDQREDVFKSFYRIDNSRNPETGGVGLGLTIARDVIRSHGGDITLSDSPLSGLRARVRLPL